MDDKTFDDPNVAQGWIRCVESEDAKVREKA